MAYVNLGQVMYPVGAIYQSWSSTSPASLFGGQWTQIIEKFLYCANSAGGTGGASSVTLNTNQIPSHKHRQNFGDHNAVVGAYEDWYADNVQVKGQYAASVSTVTTFAQTTQKTGGGGNLTRTCHPTSDAILGEETPNLFIGGGLVWHM